MGLRGNVSSCCRKHVRLVKSKPWCFRIIHARVDRESMRKPCSLRSCFRAAVQTKMVGRAAKLLSGDGTELHYNQQDKLWGHTLSESTSKCDAGPGWLKVAKFKKWTWMRTALPARSCEHSAAKPCQTLYDDCFGANMWQTPVRRWKKAEDAAARRRGAAI